MLRALQQLAEGLRALELYKLVRVLGPGKAQDLDLYIQLFKNPDGTLGGLDTGPVIVVGDDDLVGLAGNEPGLLRCQRGAKGGHGAVKSGLMQGDHVYIAL